MAYGFRARICTQVVWFPESMYLAHQPDAVESKAEGAIFPHLGSPTLNKIIFLTAGF